MQKLGTGELGEELTLKVKNITTISSYINFTTNVTRQINFNPSVESIYMPKDDFDQVMNPFNTLNTSWFDFFWCDTYLKQCFYNTTCDEVKSVYVQNHKELDFHIQLENGEMTIPWEDLYVDGNYINPFAVENRCYIQILYDEKLKRGTWELGAVAMKNYYFVYDLTSRQDNSTSPATSYRTLGIGLKNSDDVIRQQAYNISDPLFRENKNDVSYSIFKDPPKPAKKGYFFYADMGQGGKSQPDDTQQMMKFVDSLVTERNQTLSLTLNTREKDAYIFSSECSNC